MSAFDDAALDRLARHAAEWTGFSLEAILPDAIRRAAVQLLQQAGTADEVLRRAGARDPAVVHALCQAVSVGETFFFRHPEQFGVVSGTLLPAWLRQGRTVLRAWSAGCATGEEAYSLAACLLAQLPWPPTVRVEVVGTDLVERNLAAARAGLYGAWSQRPSGPLLHPLFSGASPGAASPGAKGERVSVQDRVRAVTSFCEHNLLEPWTGEPFDLIFCRNVLVYFSPDAVRTAVRHLAAALVPDGALVFGAMDVSEPPPGLVLSGLPELQIYRKPPKQQVAEPLPKAERPTPPARLPPPRLQPLEPVALHLRALVHVERGERRLAESALGDLVRLVPDYLPGLLERALSHVRQGEQKAAAALMREVLARADKLPGAQLLAGPEELPVSFYRDAAQTFLRGLRGGVE